MTGKKITRPDVLHMIVEKNRPSLTGSTGRTYQAHILLNRGRGDHNIQFEQFTAPLACVLHPKTNSLRHVLNYWTLMDNFEWAEEVKERFGLIYTDYATQKRILKDSADWYREVIATNGANLVR